MGSLRVKPGWGACKLACLMLVASLSACTTSTEMATTKQGDDAMDPTPEADASLQRPNMGNLRQALENLAADSDWLALNQAWELAQTHDAGYQAAISAREAAKTQIAQGRSQLLPQIAAGYSRSRFKGLQRQASPFGGMTEGHLKYDSDTRYVQLQQPVFNIGSIAGYRLGKALARQGEADWMTARSELALRLADIWFEALTAQARLAVHEVLATSLAKQLKAQQSLYEHAEGSKVDVHQTRARLDNAKADIIAAQAHLAVALRSLASIVGHDAAQQAIHTGPFFRLADDDNPFPLPALQPAELLAWLDRARTHNADIAARQAHVQVANARVMQTASRHAPTLNFIASWAKADSENLSLLSRETNTYMAGLQLNVPIYSGGYDTALHSQSRDEARQASHELHASLQETLVQVKNYYQEIMGGAKRIRALEDSVATGQESLYAAQQAFEYGVGSNLDLLRKQDTLFETRLKLIEAMRDYLQARIGLQVSVGQDPEHVFTEVRQIFF